MTNTAKTWQSGEERALMTFINYHPRLFSSEIWSIRGARTELFAAASTCVNAYARKHGAPADCTAEKVKGKLYKLWARTEKGKEKFFMDSNGEEKPLSWYEWLQNEDLREERERVDIGGCLRHKQDSRHTFPILISEGLSKLRISDVGASAHGEKRFYVKSGRPEACQRRRVRADRLLSDSETEQKMSRILYHIWQWLLAISKVVNIDQYCWIGLDADHTRSGAFYQLLGQALGLRAEENMVSAFRRLKLDLTEMELYVRATIGAAVCFQGLCSPFADYFADGSWGWQNVKETLTDIYPEDDASGTLSIMVRALTCDHFFRDKLTPRKAEELAQKLLQGLDPVLSAAWTRQTGSEAHQEASGHFWRRYDHHLTIAFNEALILRTELNLKAGRYQFFWIPAGAEFCPSIMDLELNQSRQRHRPAELPEEASVRATVLPGISRTMIQPGLPKDDNGPGQEQNNATEFNIDSVYAKPEGEVVLNALVVLM